MRSGAASLLTATAFVVLASVVQAQWVSFPWPGAPRLANGKVDLTAPTPRTADGKPDLSGVWRSMTSPRRAELLREGREPGLLDYEQFLTPGSAIKMLPWAEALYRGRKENFGAGIPAERCLPHSFPQAVLIRQPIQLIQTPTQTTILLEELNYFRQIFADGRIHPDERTPAWFGYSVGKWDNDVFVVDSVGFRDLWLDSAGHPSTESLRTIERYQRVDFGHMRLAITVDDSAAYVAPWTGEVQFELMADGNLIEHVCENERSAQHIVGK
jgi:hypothetical protein